MRNTSQNTISIHLSLPGKRKTPLDMRVSVSAYICYRQLAVGKELQNSSFHTLPYFSVNNSGFKRFPWNLENPSTTDKHYNLNKRMHRRKWAPKRQHQTLRKKWGFPLRISPVNVTKSARNCGFGHIYWRKF